MILVCPLVVPVGKKNISMNLNIYRNLHPQINNKAKVNFKSMMANQILKLPCLNRIKIQYTLYPKTNRKVDVSNVCSVVDKFLCDSLVVLGKLEDDNYQFVPEVTYRFGMISKEDSRVEALITEL